MKLVGPEIDRADAVVIAVPDARIAIEIVLRQVRSGICAHINDRRCRLQVEVRGGADKLGVDRNISGLAARIADSSPILSGTAECVVMLKGWRDGAVD
jgi:hypothetical protein